MGQGFTRDMESSHDIGVDNPVEGFVNHVIRLQNRCRTLKPSIVDQNVDMTESFMTALTRARSVMSQTCPLTVEPVS